MMWVVEMIPHYRSRGTQFWEVVYTCTIFPFLFFFFETVFYTFTFYLVPALTREIAFTSLVTPNDSDAGLFGEFLFL